MPPFVRLRTAGWGFGGATFSAYLAALLDLPDLSTSNVLGIDGNADMLEGLANGRFEIASYTAVEPDLVTAAFFVTRINALPNVELVLTDFVDKTDQTVEQLEPAAPFDVVLVRTPPAKMTDTHVASLLAGLRSVSRPGTKVVVSVALGCTTTSGTGAGDRLHDRGKLDDVGDYLEYEWELGMIPVYSLAHITSIAATHGWSVDDVCEPRRGFQQHHLVLSMT